MSLYKKITVSLALLAMSLSFLAQISPLWAKSADGLSIVICSAFGTRTIIIDENGNEIPQPPASSRKNCVMCLNASTNYTVPTATLARDITPYKNAVKLSWSDKIAPSNSAENISSHAIRAPPEYS